MQKQKVPSTHSEGYFSSEDDTKRKTDQLSERLKKLGEYTYIHICLCKIRESINDVSYLHMLIRYAYMHIYIIFIISFNKDLVFSQFILQLIFDFAKYNTTSKNKKL